MAITNFEPTWDAFNLSTAFETTGVNVALPFAIRATVMLAPNENTIEISEADAAAITSVKKDGVTEVYTLVNGILTVAASPNKECLVEIERSGEVVYSIFAGQMVPGVSLANGRLAGIVGNIPFTTTHTYRFGLRGEWNGLAADIVKTWDAAPADNQLTWNTDTLPEPQTDALLVSGRSFYTIGEFRRGQTIEIGIDIYNPDGTPLAVQFRPVSEMVSSTSHFSGSLPLGLTISNNPFVISGFIPAEAVAGDYFVEAFIDEPLGPTPIILHAKLLGDQFDKGTAVNHLIWQTATDLGTAVEGLASTLSITAVNTGGGPVKYRLAAGSRQLPSGLVLTDNGEIQGEVPHVSADTVIIFSAKATSGAYVAQKQFTFRILRSFESDRHVTAFLPLSGPTRRTWHSYGSQIDANRLYRPTDAHFGIPSSRILLLRGLRNSPTTLDYDRPFYLIAGEFKVAQMIHDGQYICDVIYREFFDPKSHAGGFVAGSDVIADPVFYPEDHNVQIFEGTVHNLRADLVTKVGLNAPIDKQRILGLNGGEILEPWMTCPQIDGKPTGFIAAAVVAYLLPDQGKYVIRSLTYGSIAIGAMVSFDRLTVEDGQDTHQYYFGWRAKASTLSLKPDPVSDLRVDGIPVGLDTSLHANPQLTWAYSRNDVTFTLRFYNSGNNLLRTVSGLTNKSFIYSAAMQTQDGSPGHVFVEVTAVFSGLESVTTEASIRLRSGYGIAWGFQWG